MTTRAAAPDDVSALAQVAEAAGLFPADMMADMIAPALAGGSDIWRVAAGEGDAPQGFAFARKEEMTDGVWNLLALAVHPKAQGKGHATDLLHDVEDRLRDMKARMILIDTTQRAEQAAARAFYAKAGYQHVATISDFYTLGEDKLSYVKVL